MDFTSLSDPWIFKLYALIRGYRVRLIIGGDKAFEYRMKNSYDNVVDITFEKPRPEVGWLYYRGYFSKPLAHG